MGLDNKKNDMFENLEFRKESIKEENNTINDVVETITENKDNIINDLLNYKEYIIIGIGAFLGLIYIIKRKR